VTAYATRTDLYRLGVAEGALAGVPADAQDQALEDNSRLADSYCRSRHTTPFASPYPREIVRAVCVMAAWDLLAVRGYNPEAGGDSLMQRAEKAVLWLRDIGSGKAQLDYQADATPAVQEAAPLISSDADSVTDWFA